MFVNHMFAFFNHRYLSVNKSPCLLTVTFDISLSWTALICTVIHEFLRYLVVFYAVDIYRTREREIQTNSCGQSVFTLYHNNRRSGRYFFAFVITF